MNMISKKQIAGCLVLTVLLSGALGFGGGLLASRSHSPNAETASMDYTPVTQLTGITTGAKFDAQAVAAKTMNSVVEIKTESITRGNRMMGQFISEGAGSGVIISNDGKIVTNYHVIAGANKITVRMRSGTEYAATLVGSDAQTDLAVLKISASGLPAATYGSSSTLVVGESVLAIGNPLGELGGTVTDGIISALDRQIEIDGETMTLLQTNASINPGNSGGGLFDADGKLVGIVNAKSSGSGLEGLGFAIPIDTAKYVIDQLITNGYVTGRVDAGMSFTDVSDQAAYLYRLGKGGVYVASVTRGGNAETIGIQRGDRIVSFDGVAVKTAAEIEALLKQHHVGDSVKLTVERTGKQTTLSLVLGEQRPTGSIF